MNGTATSRAILLLPLLMPATLADAAPKMQSDDWREVATVRDRARLRGWRDSWMQGLASARSEGSAGDIATDPTLFEPDRALADPVPPAGAYRCRTFKLGGKSVATHAFAAYPPTTCRVAADDGKVTFAELGGPQRQIGRIYDDTNARAVFLGTVVLGDESKPLAYGRDATRNQAGVVERIGPSRWRITFPFPRFESTIDVVELTPAD